jgi:hypothetical protein
MTFAAVHESGSGTEGELRPSGNYSGIGETAAVTASQAEREVLTQGGRCCGVSVGDTPASHLVVCHGSATLAGQTRRFASTWRAKLLRMASQPPRCCSME